MKSNPKHFPLGIEIFKDGRKCSYRGPSVIIYSVKKVLWTLLWHIAAHRLSKKNALRYFVQMVCEKKY